MKEYTVTFTMDDNGAITLSRANDGFNIAELLGMTEILKDDIFRQLVRKDDEPLPKIEVRHKRVCIKHDEEE